MSMSRRKKGEYLTAAEAVLQSAGVPSSVREITSRALASKALVTEGKTPEASMSSALYVDTRSNADTHFVRIAPTSGSRAPRGSGFWDLRR
jgi:hypothetical protein